MTRAPAAAVRARTAATRLAALRSHDPSAARIVDHTLRLVAASLPRMLRDDGTAGHSLRAHDGLQALVGSNPRYTAIVALGCRHLQDEDQRALLRGHDVSEVLDTAAAGIDATSDDDGAVALTCWAAAATEHPATGDLVALLRRRNPTTTVERAWAISALTAAGAVDDAARHVVEVLAAQTSAGLFRHRDARGPRNHIGCFADQVYPIQALARFHAATGRDDALEAAERAAEQICALQGSVGQWWWHYDVRTASVVEGYPVYSVHQDAMGPMALLDLAAAGGTHHDRAIRRSLAWLAEHPETERDILDDDAGVIWRKVCRRDPRKAVRALRGAVTRVHADARLEWLDHAFPADTIDRESRPYHLGWILDTWLGEATT